MVDNQVFTNMALGFPEATESPHFEKSSFRVNKKIFATLDSSKAEAVLKLSPDQQIEYCDAKLAVISPVKGKWGEQGWTSIKLDKVHPELLSDAIKSTYKNVAPKKLSDLT